MRFLLRMAFWLTVILALLPSGGSQPTPKVNVSAIEAMSAAKATVTDMRSFCERQPDACSVGSQAAAAIGHRAQAGAKMLYEYLSEHLGPPRRRRGGECRRPASPFRCLRRGLAAHTFAGRSGAGLARPAASQGSARRSAGLKSHFGFGTEPLRY